MKLDPSVSAFIIALVTVVLAFVGKDLFTYLINKRNLAMDNAKIREEVESIDIDNQTKELTLAQKYKEFAADALKNADEAKAKFDELSETHNLEKDECNDKLIESAQAFAIETDKLREQIKIISNKLDMTEFTAKKWFEYSVRLQTQLKLYNIIPVPFEIVTAEYIEEKPKE